MSYRFKSAAGFLSGWILLTLLSAGEVCAQASDTIIKEAKKLHKISNAYFVERVKSDWRAIYGLQHPNFKEHITYEEFVNYDGKIAVGKAHESAMHVSGGKTSQLPIKTKIIQKRNMLGHPIPHQYQIIPKPLVTIKKRMLDKVSISKDGRFARVDWMLDIREQLNPALFRAIIITDYQMPFTDHFEKFDGQWVVAFMKNKISFSGSPLLNYYVPNNIDALKEIEFIEILPEKIEHSR